MVRGEAELGSRPLERALWGGAVDNVGGDELGWLTRTVQPGGNIASIGLAGGIKLETTVMPFILRGINLLGINSVYVPHERRVRVWQRLATDLKPPSLRCHRHAHGGHGRSRRGVRRLHRGHGDRAAPWSSWVMSSGVGRDAAFHRFAAS